MRPLVATLSAVVAVAVVALLPAGSSGAQASRQGVVQPEWLTVAGLESDRGRLKRLSSIRMPIVPVANGWRQPAQAVDLTARDDDWRTAQVIRPSVEPAPAPAPAPQPAADE